MTTNLEAAPSAPPPGRAVGRPVNLTKPGAEFIV